MNEFVNTIDILGDEAVQDAWIEGTLTEFSDNRLVMLKTDTFEYCGLLKSANLPLVTTVGDYTFHEVSSLTRVCFPAASKVYGKAFFNATMLSVVHLPALTAIDKPNSSFQNTALDTLILSNRHVVATLSSTEHFTGTPIANGTGYIYVRKILLEQYQSSTNWSALQIRAIEDYPEIKAIVDADIAEMRGAT